MIRPRNQPSLLDHLLESGFILWLYSIGYSVMYSLIIYSEWGEILKNEFFPLLLLATALFFANIFLAGFKYSNWLADCDRSQKEVLITLKCYEVFRVSLKLFMGIMVGFLVVTKLFNLMD